jgi:hypothetical protein
MELPIVDCKLDQSGIREQRDRYRRLGLTTESIGRDGKRLVVRFGPGLDVDLLEQALAIESSCCPFFQLEHLRDERVLLVGVEREEQLPALEALAWAIGDGRAD